MLCLLFTKLFPIPNRPRTAMHTRHAKCEAFSLQLIEEIYKLRIPTFNHVIG